MKVFLRFKGAHPSESTHLCFKSYWWSQPGCNPGLTRVRKHENSQSELCLQSNSKTMCKLIQVIFSFICSLRLQWCVFKEKIDIIQNLTNLNFILHLTKMSPPTRVEPGFTPGWTRVEIQNSETIFWFCPYKRQINLKCFCKFFGGSWQCKLVSDTIWFRHLSPILNRFLEL